MNVYLTVGIIHVSIVIGLAIAEVGRTDDCDNVSDWSLLIVVLILIVFPLVCGFLGGKTMYESKGGIVSDDREG